MIRSTIRVIRSRNGDRQLPDLLQMVFGAELVLPSRCLWLISPWITDVAIIDNRTNAFASVEPHWARSEIRLSQLLTSLARRGTTVRVATRPDPINDSVIARIEVERVPNIIIRRQENLHEKGLLGDGFYLGGSMNFTTNGVLIGEEAVHFNVDPAVIAESRVVLTERWGGEIYG